VVRQPKRLALLVHLACARPRGFQRRDALLALFWPELDAARARNALDQSLHFLRRQLGAESVVSRGRGDVALDAAYVACDVVAFEAALDAGGAEGALARYRGEFLAGFHVSGLPELERWIDDERARLRTRARHAAHALATAAAAARNDVGAAQWLREALRITGDDEPALAELMTILERTGDRAGALREYDAFARRLREDHGAAPGAATQALAARIRAGTRDAAGARAPAEARDAREGDTREGEPREGEPREGEPRDASIAVLPFVDLGSPESGAGGADSYFADGLTEELIAALAAIPALRVASRTSSFVFKGRAATVRAIGRELGVAALLEGSVRRTGERLRITAQLVDARADTHLWAHTYDRELADVFAIQSDVAARIAGALRVTLSPAARRRIEWRPTASREAFDRYLRARLCLNRNTPDSLREAVAVLEEALVRDPDYAAAHAALAEAYAALPLFPFRGGSLVEAHARARAAAERALALYPGLVEARTALAIVRWYEWDWDGADAEFRRAIEEGSGYAAPHKWYGLYLSSVGRFEEAMLHLERALELDPLSLRIQTDIGTALIRARRFDDAISRMHRVLEVEPNYAPAHRVLGEACHYTGRYTLGVHHMGLAGVYPPDVGAELAGALHDGLTSEEAERALIPYLAALGASPVLLATRYANAGMMDEAFRHVERAIAARDPLLITVRVHPGWDRLSTDPRGRAVLERMGVARRER
jgi:TolB-like protein